MYENSKLIYEDEKTINLVDLCLQILKRWKLMVLAAVLFAALAGAATYYKSSSALEAPAAEPAKMTEAEQEAFEIKLAKIREYEANIEERDYYLENSIKVKLDPNSYYEGTAVYVLSAANNSELVKAAEFCVASLINEDSFEELAAAISGNEDVTLLKEVVSVEKEYYVTDRSAEAKLMVKVQHFDEKECETMLSFMEAKMSDALQLLGKAGLVSAEEISACVYTTANTELMSLSSNMLSARNASYDAFVALEAGMTELEKKYYVAEEGAGDQVSEDLLTAEALTEPSVDWKIVIVAAFVGVFLVAALFGVLYLFSGRVHNKEELESWVSVPVFTPEKDLGMTAAMLAGIAGTHQAKKIYFTGSLENVASETAKKLGALLAEKGITLVEGASILNGADALQAMTDCGFVMFAEKCNESRERELREELLKAGSCGVQVLSIVLEK